MKFKDALDIFPELRHELPELFIHKTKDKQHIGEVIHELNRMDKLSANKIVFEKEYRTFISVNSSGYSIDEIVTRSKETIRDTLETFMKTHSNGELIKIVCIDNQIKVFLRIEETDDDYIFRQAKIKAKNVFEKHNIINRYRKPSQENLDLQFEKELAALKKKFNKE